MSMQRWEPLGDIASAMDRWFEEGFGRPWRLLRGGVEETSWFPVEVSETENEIEVKAAIPGAKAEDIDISVHDDMLMLKAETRKDFEDRQKNYYRQEFRYGMMQRAISLPSRVEAELAQATYQDGVLRLQLPKSEQARSKQIKVKSGDSRQTIEASGQPREHQSSQGQSSQGQSSGAEPAGYEQRPSNQ